MFRHILVYQYIDIINKAMQYFVSRKINLSGIVYRLVYHEEDKLYHSNFSYLCKEDLKKMLYVKRMLLILARIQRHD